MKEALPHGEGQFLLIESACQPLLPSHLVRPFPEPEPEPEPVTLT